MRITATLLLMTAIGCGGAGEKTESTTPATDSQAEAMPPAAPAPEAPAPAETAAAPAPDAAATPASAPAPEPPPAASLARAEVRMLKGDKPLGTMTFSRSGSVVTITGEFSGHKKGDYALYVHDKGDCSDRGRKIGGHLNPTGAKHGPPASPQRHAGDFGNVTFDKEGNATFSMETDSVTLEADRPDGVVGRAVVVYSRKDNKSGKPGSPLACGVVMLDGAQPAGGAPAEAPAAATPASATTTP